MEFKQESMLNQDGTMPESSIVSRNLSNEADLIFNTPEQKNIALEMIRDGKAKDLTDAWSKLRDEAIANPVNDAWVKKN